MMFSFILELCCLFFFFFFSSRRRHTRLTCDWSSDVCSSDLAIVRAAGADRGGAGCAVKASPQPGGGGNQHKPAQDLDTNNQRRRSAVGELAGDPRQRRSGFGGWRTLPTRLLAMAERVRR